MKKVIVFTMAYNAQATIERTIESILNQTFRNFEYYILDNASTDKTGEIIYDYHIKDERIIPIRVNKNDTLNGGAFLGTLVYATNAEYIVWCDADDTYTPDFLENMVEFSEENQLDIAACGYDTIDGLTGDVIKHRVIEKNMILHDELFRDEFIQYRGFTLHIWGKLYSVPFLKKEKQSAGTSEEEKICSDSDWVLGLFQKAKKAGIYGKAMYHHYRYPNSLSYTLIKEGDGLSGYRNLWMATKNYLESYGTISKLNEDFLYAIHLSFVDEAAGNILSADWNTEKKLELLEVVFNDPIWVETMTQKADPMFLNLAERKTFVSNLKDKILSLPEIDVYSAEKQRLLRYLDRTKCDETLKIFAKHYMEIEKEALKRKQENLFDMSVRQTCPLILYGAGENCRYALSICNTAGIRVDGICDSKTTGIYHYGEQNYNIIPPDKLINNYQDAIVLITSWHYEKEIYSYLCGAGFAEKNIYFLRPYIIPVDAFRKQYWKGYRWSYNFFADKRSRQRILDRIQLLLPGKDKSWNSDTNYGAGYFSFPDIPLEENEIFIDGGAYIGDSAEEFINIMKAKGRNYRHIYSFEPDPDNYRAAKKSLSQYGNIDVIPYGLWSCCTEFEFISTPIDSSSSHLTQIKEPKATKVSVTSLDAFFVDKPVDEWPTIIKMDIEGAEKEALLGASKIIKKKKPTLIICAYHKPEDIYELPQTILKLRADYKFSFWQIGESFWDLILYAI